MRPFSEWYLDYNVSTLPLLTNILFINVAHFPKIVYRLTVNVKKLDDLHFSIAFYPVILYYISGTYLFPAVPHKIPRDTLRFFRAKAMPKLGGGRGFVVGRRQP